MAAQLTPEVLWAQRSCHDPERNYVFLTIAIHDVPEKNLNLDMQEKKVVLTARSDRQDVEYHLELNLHDHIYHKETVRNHTDRHLELKLYKEEPNYWWPHLLSSLDTPPYVKQDFGRWVNEDEQDGEPDPEEERINNMVREEIQLLANAALSHLEASQDLATPADEKPTADTGDASHDTQVTEEDSGSEEDEDEDARENDGLTFSDDDNSDDEDSPSPPGGNGSGSNDLEKHDDTDHDHYGGSEPSREEKSSSMSSMTIDDDAPKDSHEKLCNVASEEALTDFHEKSEESDISTFTTAAKNSAADAVQFSSENSAGCCEVSSQKRTNDGAKKGQPHASLFGGNEIGFATGFASGHDLENSDQGEEGLNRGKEGQNHGRRETSCGTKPDGLSRKDWADNLDGVRRIITSAGRTLPWHLRPLTFETWKKRVDRTIELRNSRESRLMQLPREIRLRIFEYALVCENSVHFCPRLRPDFRRSYNEMLRAGVYEKNQSRDFKLQKEIKNAKKKNFSHYFLGDDFVWCKSPGLLHVSRAVSEEAGIILYRKNTFSFRDVYGFVALECFLNTVSQFNLNQIRKLEVHVPIWFHGPTLDKLRSTWVLKSATSFGLVPTMPHKDRLRGSFETCIRKLARSGRLKELNLIVKPSYVEHWHMEYHEATSSMPKNKQMVYAKRLSVEEFCFRHILASIPKLKITVIAEEGFGAPWIHGEEFPGELEQYKQYYAAVEAKCKHYGFHYVQRHPAEVRDFITIMFEEYTCSI